MLFAAVKKRDAAMQTVDAYWDTRSLGVKCGQIIFSEKDGAAALEEATSFSRDYDYVTAKMPTSCVGLIPALERQGFSFAECVFEVVLKLRDARPSLLMKRMAGQMGAQEADDNLKQEIFNQIREGIFDTDRVSLDSKFGEGRAAQRYINWIEDELERGGLLFYVTYKGEGAGFFSYKEPKPGVEAWPFLAGVFKEYRGSGIGSNVSLDASRMVAQQRGCSRIRTYVSSNNPAILRAQIAYGYQVERMSYVLVRHRCEDNITIHSCR